MTPAEQAGSLAEEAAKLIAVVQQWTQADHEPTDEHHHDGDGRDEVCRYCPICSVVRLARETSPEVRAQVSAAAVSFGLAMKALVEEHLAPVQDDPDHVEKINLADDGDDD